MGVTGLWKLIEPCGKPVPVETLEGKVLAVDISIWLHQVVKGFQDNKGAALNNAHLLGLFHRLCKLMYYRVKPVFVFDGCVPQLKRDTIARRQQQRSKLNSEADRIQALLLQSLAKEKIVQQALGPNAELLITSPIKKLATAKASRKGDSVDDMFKLPELPSSSKSNPNPIADGTTDESFNETSFNSDDCTTTSATDSSMEECNPRHAYNTNLQAIDVKNKEFLQLPPDVRHEILVDIKETRKQSSWGRLHELPAKSNDFSNFQMKRLLKRRDVQVSLEAAEQEMGGRTLTYNELKNLFTEEGILETDAVEKGTKQITSDEHTRFLLVKDLKKKLSKVQEEKIKNEENSTIINVAETQNKPSTSNDEDPKLGNEYDADLEMAIALSLEDDTSGVYDEKDYDYDSDENLKLSKEQRKQLQNAAKGPARSYMIEYAGMNKEEVTSILETTQPNTDMDVTAHIERLVGDTDEKQKEIKELCKDMANEKATNKASQDIRLHVTDDSDETDSDLEEVANFKKYDTSGKINNTAESELKATAKTITEIKKVLDSEEIEDSDATDSDFEEVGASCSFQSKPNYKTLNIEEECVIEETPPRLEHELEKETKNIKCKILSIQVDLTEPLKPEDDIFAEIFEDIKPKKEMSEKDLTFSKAAEENKTEKKTVDSLTTSLEKCKETTQPNNKTATEINISAKTEEILSILDELKEQAHEIKNIKLENIKLGEGLIEISDDETAIKGCDVKTDVIEICDSDDNGKRPLTPPPRNESPKVNTKSPNFKTPSKSHSITEYFNVNYVVKRTPDKPINDEDEKVAKVKSPFFVHKTPKSGQKINSNSPSPAGKPSKANKILFDQATETSSKDYIHDLDNDFIPIKETDSTNGENILVEAANILKAQKTSEELNSIASDLVKERQELESERNRQDRMGVSITQRMNSDCQDLLRLFGVPFIVAPMEAEAQCAFLDIVQLTNGTITDDSDIWLFGGRTVYKNFFAQNKHVMEFRSEQIQKDFNCDRTKLIQLACLVGSDYTSGIHGIGTVTALEILASFGSKESANKLNETANAASTQNILTTLQRFRNWWLSFKSAAVPPGSSARVALQKKLKNIEIYESFPNTAVVEAYLTPKVDENKDSFSWGYPDVESLREFARKNFGWTTNKTDEILKPVLKKLNEKRTQQSIRNYFNVKSALSLRQIRVSKRVQNAIEKMSGSIDSADTAEKPTKAKRARKHNKAADRKRKELALTLDTEGKEGNDITSKVEPSCSNLTARGAIKRATKRINIPETKQIIPQREKDLAQMETNKKLAVEMLKNTAKEPKKNRKA